MAKAIPKDLSISGEKRTGKGMPSLSVFEKVTHLEDELKTGDIEEFAQQVLKVPLYPYQLEVCKAILDSVENEKGYTFSIMFARQMRKIS